MSESPQAAPAPRRHAAVFSGGGAKGVFESGVLHALVRTGYEPDVITGSSVGAINAATLAELIRVRRQEGEPARDALLERTLRLWQLLDRWKVADFDPWGRRLLALEAVLVLLGAGLLIWAFSGPPISPAAEFWLRAGALLLGGSLLWGALHLVLWWKRLPKRLAHRIHRGMTAATELLPPDVPSVRGLARRLLRALGLYPSLFRGEGLENAVRHLIPGERRFSDFQQAGVELRLTRTNLRTGRTEISERVTRGQLLRPGTVRGRRVPGNPEIVPAVLASAAFPVAFPTVEADRIFPAAENPELSGVIAERSHALRALTQLFGERAESERIWLHTVLDSLEAEDPTLLQVGREGGLYRRLKERFVGGHALWMRIATHTVDLLIDTRHWPELKLPEFAKQGDRYFDGGVLDNTPLSSALEALRELQAADERSGAWDPAAATAPHELLVVLLSPPARRLQLSPEEAAALQGPELGLRALRLQSEQRLAADARVAEKINRLLARQAEERARAVPAPQPAAVGSRTGPRKAPRFDLPEGENWREILSAGDGAAPEPMTTLDTPVRERLTRVDLTRVVPAWDLPWLLALDDRLGFRAADAEAFQARGCRDTLQALVREQRKRSAPGQVPAEHVRQAAQFLGAGSLTRPVLPGWICRAEHCLLRGACDRVAAREAQTAQHTGEAAAANA